MDLETRKITFVQEFLRLQNEEIVSGLEDLLRRKMAEQYEQKLQRNNPLIGQREL